MKKSKIIMIAGALMLLLLFAFPIWNISITAPQYPEAIGMDIWINQIKDHNPNDIQNINILNHYVGMKDIPKEMEEFRVFPAVVIGMAIIGVIFGLIGNRRLYVVWFVTMVLLGIAGMYDFYLWEYDYGHNLKQNAAIKFSTPDGEPMAYQPPLIGSKTILNFQAMSYPMIGSFFLALGMAMSVLAFFKSKKEDQPPNKYEAA